MTGLASLAFISSSALLLAKHKIASFRKHYRCTSYIKECLPLCPVRAITIKKRATTTRNATKKTCSAKKTAKRENLHTQRRRIIYKKTAVPLYWTALFCISLSSIPSETSPSPHAVHPSIVLVLLLSPPFFQMLSAVPTLKRRFLRCRPPIVRRQR